MRQKQSPAELERFISNIFKRRALLLALLIHLFVFIAAPTYTLKTIPPPPPPVVTVEHIYEPPEEQIKQRVHPRAIQPYEPEDDADLPEDLEIAETVLEHATYTPDIPPPLMNGTSSIHISYDIKPVPIRLINPEYPELARLGNISGTVYVELLIGTDGHVKDIRIADGPEIFHDSVINAVRTMIFKPAQARGRPVSVWITMPFRFTLCD
jgi:protein TonB